MLDVFLVWILFVNLWCFVGGSGDGWWLLMLLVVGVVVGGGWVCSHML